MISTVPIASDTFPDLTKFQESTLRMSTTF